MINTPLSEVLAVMKRDKLSMYKVYSQGDVIALNESKMNPEAAAENLENFISALEGSGCVEIALPEKTGAEIKGKGGNIRPVYKFTVRVGGGGGSAIQGVAVGVSTSAEKVLREELEKANLKLQEMEWKIKLDKLEAKWEEKITGLQEKSGIEKIGEILALPQMQMILGKLFPGLRELSSPALNGGPVAVSGSAAVDEDTRIDNATDILIDVYGVDVVADLFDNLAAVAKKNPETLRTFFPQLKMMAV